MIPMNELMQVNIAKVHNFFDDLAVMAPGDGFASLLCLALTQQRILFLRSCRTSPGWRTSS
jgi:hypothetical protein